MLILIYIKTTRLEPTLSGQNAVAKVKLTSKKNLLGVIDPAQRVHNDPNSVAGEEMGKKWSWP